MTTNSINLQLSLCAHRLMFYILNWISLKNKASFCTFININCIVPFHSNGFCSAKFLFPSLIEFSNDFLCFLTFFERQQKSNSHIKDKRRRRLHWRPKPHCRTGWCSLTEANVGTADYFQFGPTGSAYSPNSWLKLVEKLKRYDQTLCKHGATGALNHRQWFNPLTSCHPSHTDSLVQT